MYARCDRRNHAPVSNEDPTFNIGLGPDQTRKPETEKRRTGPDQCCRLRHASDNTTRLKAQNYLGISSRVCGSAIQPVTKVLKRMWQQSSMSACPARKLLACCHALRDLHTLAMRLLRVITSHAVMSSRWVGKICTQRQIGEVKHNEISCSKEKVIRKITGYHRGTSCPSGNQNRPCLSCLPTHPQSYQSLLLTVGETALSDTVRGICERDEHEPVPGPSPPGLVPPRGRPQLRRRRLRRLLPQ